MSAITHWYKCLVGGGPDSRVGDESLWEVDAPVIPDPDGNAIAFAEPHDAT